MRILYVVPNVPSRIRARPFNFISRLSKDHDVFVLCLATDDSDHRFLSELRRCCQCLEVVQLPRWMSFWNCLVGLFSSTPLRYAYFYSSHLRQRVRERVGQGEVDLVHIEHLKSFPMVEDIAGRIPTVFDAVDCVSLFEARRTKLAGNALLKLFYWTEWKKMLRWEAKACERFDSVVITSAVDKESYPVPKHLQKAIHVIPNGVDLEYFRFQQFEPRRNVLIFCAKLDYSANTDAALYFSQSIWPLLLARRPELQLEIVGSRPPRSVQRLNGRDNIRVVGAVPDVRPFLGRAWVALCPVRVQAGIQNKILEAMALGVPVVATRICCSALAVEHAKHLLLADTPQEYVSAVELLLDDRNLRTDLVQAGRKYVEQYHDWNDSVARLCDTYSGAVTDFTRSSGQPALV